MDKILYQLKYDKQTEELCLKSVRKNGLYLMYVINQTKDICLAAVKQEGCAIL